MTQQTINFNTNNLLRICEVSRNYSPLVISWVQFNKKNAYVSNCIKNRYFIVRSYNTIVAIIDDQEGVLFELGKWTTTTSKQVTQLYNLDDNASYNMFGFQKLDKRYLFQ